MSDECKGCDRMEKLLLTAEEGAANYEKQLNNIYRLLAERMGVRFSAFPDGSDDIRWQYMHANGTWFVAESMEDAMINVRTLYVLSHEAQGRERVRANHFEGHCRDHVNDAVKKAVEAVQQKLDRALKRLAWWKRLAKRNRWSLPKKRKEIATGQFPNRRPLTLAEAAAGGSPQEFTDTEWENMLPDESHVAYRREVRARRKAVE